MKIRHHAGLVLAISVCFAVVNDLAAQTPCARSTDSPAFLSAASDIAYGCGYLLESKPPQYALAETNFRQALHKEPANAVAHFLLGVSFAGGGQRDSAQAAFARAREHDAQIMTKAAELFERAPALRALVDAALAPVPAVAAGAPAAPKPAAPDAPVTPAVRAPAAAKAFEVGAAVEIEYRNGEWFPGVVTSVAGGACPYYRVRADVYGNGNPSNLGYGCKSVRAPTGIKAPVAQCGGSNPNCKPSAPPPLGRYACNVTRWDVAERRVKFDYKGYFELLAGGRYRWLDNGGTGTYAYDARTHAVSWRSGPLRAQGGVATYGLDGKTPEITITFGETRWQCG